MLEAQHVLIGVLAERLSRSPADIEVRSFVAVWETALITWVEDDGRGDLLEMLDQGIAFLVAGCPL